MGGTEQDGDVPSAESGLGWYAHRPVGHRPQEIPGPVALSWIGLSDDEWSGPQVSDVECFEDDLEALAEIGVRISPSLHAHVLDWHARATRRPGESDRDGASPLFAEKQALLTRLAACAPDGIQVEKARTQPRRRFHPAALSIDEDGRFRAGHADRISSPGDWTGTLPSLAIDLAARLRSWLADLPASAWARPRRRSESQSDWEAAVRAWEDRTLPLAQRLQTELGDDWDVRRVP